MIKLNVRGAAMGVINYAELTLTELKQIDPEKTFCLVTISPLEVHGPHLPLGTDVFIGNKLQSEYCKALTEQYPDYNLVVLPSIYAGCDPVPVKGSIAVKARTLEKLIGDIVRGLAQQGFKFLIVCDNHGGPSHQMAMEVAAVKAWRRFRFFLINPFNVVFKKMVRHDPAFLRLIGLAPGECGDDADAHAGTNETSLMLCTNAELVKSYQEVAASGLPARIGVAAVIATIASVLGKIGFAKAKTDLEHLANMLAWTGNPGNLPYLGSPADATAEAGERMLRGHVAVMKELVACSIAGENPPTQPMLWWMRLFRR